MRRLGSPTEAAVRHREGGRGTRRPGLPDRVDREMSAIEVRSEPTIGASIARRAVDLALDGRVSRDEGTDHLCRLGRGRRGALEEALGELCRSPGTRPEEGYARLLLCHAIVRLAASRRIPG
jgi:hypothetical protein